MALRLIPHIHRATHRIALYIEEPDDPKLNQAEAHVLAYLASAGEATIGQVHRAFGSATISKRSRRASRRPSPWATSAHSCG